MWEERIFPFFPFFWIKPVAGCGLVSSFRRMCETMIRLQMAVCWCVCFSVRGLMFPGFVVKLWVCLCNQLPSFDTVHSDSLSCCNVPTDPFFFLKRHPLTNAAPLLNDGIAPLLSLYLSSFISFSFSESERQPPPPSSLPPSFFPFPWGLCSQPSRAEPEASLSLALIGRTWPTCSPSGPPLLRYPPQLSGCSHGITLQLQWEESRGREGDRQRARESQRAQNGHG